MTGNVPTQIAAAVAAYGVRCKEKLDGPGDPEAAIRTPLDDLLTVVAQTLGYTATFHDEVRDEERAVRPDYAVRVGGAINGYVEVKRPGASLDPASFTGHNLRQWERQRDLPNLLYTNGTEWRFYRDGEVVSAPVRFTGGPLETAGDALVAPSEFETLVRDFLTWRPAPITSVSALVRAVAPLTRLLRGEVVDQLASERRAVVMGADETAQPFGGLANDWRGLLFPDADDDTFADGYAQTVVFALLLARTEGIDITEGSLHDVGRTLGQSHSLMGRALQLLTDSVAGDFQVTLALLVRVVGAVDWARIRKGRRDTYLHLYEHFLEEYDNDLRKASGSYYTPHDLVVEMVRLTESALVHELGKADGFADPGVTTVDPAMGTGTYLHTILERVAEQTTSTQGEGLRGPAVTQAARQLVGFELQMGPYAVAELRTADLLADFGATPPKGGMRLFVTDTLDDPHGASAQLGSTLQAIARSRKAANKVKATEAVTVVIGNPPYRQLADGVGGWVENGSAAHGRQARGILEDFFDDNASRTRAKLKNLYVYFWRWATWKVWESTSGDDAGVVCFVTTSGYVASPAFTGMRRYLRRYASDGWIIDLTPEGQTPPIPTRLFPTVRQPLAIGVFIRRPGTSTSTPARIRWRALSGNHRDKLEALKKVDLHDDGWADARTDWTAPLTPEAETAWDDWPAVADLLPWRSPGIFPTRRWVYAPEREILQRRWARLTSEPSPTRKAELFKEGRDAHLAVTRAPLPGTDVHPVAAGRTVDEERPADVPRAVRVAYRAFDRQWLLADPRLMDMPRRPLWFARIRADQVFIVEQHTKAARRGPALLFTALVPDFDSFKGSEGGRVFPVVHPDGSANLARGLVNALTTALGIPVSREDVVAYIAGITGFDGYTSKFIDELRTPGVRVPMAADAARWQGTVALGEELLWASTYGARYANAGRALGDVRYPTGDARQPQMTKPLTDFPREIAYDADRRVVTLGAGEFGPVSPDVWSFTVADKSVIGSWFNYRQAEPGGKKTSDLDLVHLDVWPASWSIEFIDLLTVLTRLVELRARQAANLEEVLTGPLLTVADLSTGGVAWPRSDADRGVRYDPTLTLPAEGDVAP